MLVLTKLREMSQERSQVSKSSISPVLVGSNNDNAIIRGGRTIDSSNLGEGIMRLCVFPQG